jgi:hypothetical protein
VDARVRGEGVILQLLQECRDDVRLVAEAAIRGQLVVRAGLMDREGPEAARGMGTSGAGGVTAWKASLVPSA